MADHWKKAPSVKKEFPEPKATEQYEKPLGPERPTEFERIKGKFAPITGNPYVKRATTYLSERSYQIAHEMQHSSKGGKRRRPINYNLSMPGNDPFGVTFAAPGFGTRKKKRRGGNGGGGTEFMEPGYIPDSMRHLF